MASPLKPHPIIAVDTNVPLDLAADSEAALDAAAAPKLSSGDRFSSSSTWDALNRATQLVAPHTSAMRPNVIQPSYNEANLLERVDAWLQEQNEPNSLLDPTTSELRAVTGVASRAGRSPTRR